MKLRRDCTKCVLENLLPEANISGGTFIDSLPDPNELTPQQARNVIQCARFEAANATVSELLEESGLNENPPLESRPDGSQIWPEGFSGSVTHKGTRVLGALIDKRKSQVLGVDLERYQDCSELSNRFKPSERPPVLPDHLSVLGAFSAFESVYKALKPTTDTEFGFNDIRLDWSQSLEQMSGGVAYCPKSMRLSIRCAYSGKWVISVARTQSETE